MITMPVTWCQVSDTLFHPPFNTPKMDRSKSNGFHNWPMLRLTIKVTINDISQEFLAFSSTSSFRNSIKFYGCFTKFHLKNPKIVIIFVTCKNLQNFVIKRCYIFRIHPNISVALALINFWVWFHENLPSFFTSKPTFGGRISFYRNLGS